MQICVDMDLGHMNFNLPLFPQFNIVLHCLYIHDLGISLFCVLFLYVLLCIYLYEYILGDYKYDNLLRIRNVELRN